ncbi:MAG: S-methyl-5-thioribose-1-phosphate isomerase [Rhizobiales bacterium]|nr:S-methyl-5-thioribose-1-phosphate isomerase [Hyphomicrobiales bacterium]
MLVDGVAYRTIWPVEEGAAVEIVDQTRLPHAFVVVRLHSLEDVAVAISNMLVRGAPLIGATAAWGMALAMREDASDAGLARAAARLARTRPTAVNLFWAIERCRAALSPLAPTRRAAAAHALAVAICDEDVAINDALGDHGLALLRDLAARKRPGARLNILTHCNAGWLATVDWGTATAPIYKAHAAGLDVHVWVDETRPRNQGASLTAWELAHHGVPATLIVDNAGGHLMQRGEVDVVIVGTDRTTANGDVCNKIGTYLKALAAQDNGVPFYVAAPSPSIDGATAAGGDIGIEERAAAEVTWMTGLDETGATRRVGIAPPGVAAANPAFDVTPARLVTGLITEHGVVSAEKSAISAVLEKVGRPRAD